MTDITEQPGIEIAQIFLDKVSFSHRADYLLISASTKPKVGDVNVQIESGLSEDSTKGLLRVTVGTVPENNPIYNFEVSVVGLFNTEEGGENMPLKDFLRVNGVATLYPFLRYAVAETTLKGRFGPVWMNPFNVTVMAGRAGAEKESGVKGSPAKPRKQKRVSRKARIVRKKQ